MLKNFCLKVFLVACVLQFVNSGTYAQKAFENWAVGLDGGSCGPGLTLATSLSSHVFLQTGFDYVKATYPHEFNVNLDGFMENAPERNVPLETSLRDPKLNLTHFKAIVDLYPVKNGIFSFSAGIYAGRGSFSILGKINNYDEVVEDYKNQHPGEDGGNLLFTMDDVVVKPDPDGSVNGSIRMGSAIKPYVGIGFGRTIATNNRVGFKFNLGLIYQGNYTFESDQVYAPNGNVINKVTKATELTKVPGWLLNCWPVININLSYRF